MNKEEQKWQQRFTTLEDGHKKLFERASRHYDILYAVQNTTDMAPWRAKLYIPVLASKAWDLVSRLSGVTPYFQTKIEDIALSTETEDYVIPQDTVRRQKRLDAKLRKDYECGTEEPIKLRVADVLLDAVVAGTGWAKVSWETKKKRIYSKQYDDDGMVKNPDKDEYEEREVGYNNYEPLNFFNVFADLNAPSWAKQNYMIVRSFKPFHELEKNPNYNLNDIFDSPKTTDFSNQNQARNRVVNGQTIFTSDDTVQTATIYECYERKADGIYMSTYAEGKGKRGWVKIRPAAKRYWHPYYPVVPSYIRKKSFSVHGESLFENNATLQAGTNDIFNHYLDNLNVSLDSMIMYEDGTLTSDFVVEPGGEITFTGAEPKQFKFPEPNPAQISMVMNQLEKAIEQATVPQYISGMPDSSTDKTAGTAKGISMITEAATEKIGFMKDNFKQSMTIVGRIELSNLSQFQSEPEQVEYQEDGQQKPDVIMPVDYKGDIEVTIDDDSMLPLTKDERRDIALQGYAQMKQMQDAAISQAQFFQDQQAVPKINYSEIMDDVASFYFPKNSNRYISKEVAPAQNVVVPPEGAPTGAPAEQINDPSSGQSPVDAVMQGLEGAQYGATNGL